MAFAVHLICKARKHGELGFDGLTALKEPGLFESGWWDMPEADAEDLRNGWVYLHETKAESSHFAGIVLDWKIAHRAELKRPHRVVFTLRKRPDAGRQKWRGRNDANAHNGGTVPATLPHEVAPTA